MGKGVVAAAQELVGGVVFELGAIFGGSVALGIEGVALLLARGAIFHGDEPACPVVAVVKPLGATGGFGHAVAEVVVPACGLEDSAAGSGVGEDHAGDGAAGRGAPCGDDATREGDPLGRAGGGLLDGEVAAGPVSDAGEAPVGVALVAEPFAGGGDDAGEGAGGIALVAHGVGAAVLGDEAAAIVVFEADGDGGVDGFYQSALTYLVSRPGAVGVFRFVEASDGIDVEGGVRRAIDEHLLEPSIFRKAKLVGPAIGVMDKSREVPALISKSGVVAACVGHAREQVLLGVSIAGDCVTAIGDGGEVAGGVVVAVGMGAVGILDAVEPLRGVDGEAVNAAIAGVERGELAGFIPVEDGVVAAGTGERPDPAVVVLLGVKGAAGGGGERRGATSGEELSGAAGLVFDRPCAWLATRLDHEAALAKGKEMIAPERLDPRGAAVVKLFAPDFHSACRLASRSRAAPLLFGYLVGRQASRAECKAEGRLAKWVFCKDEADGPEKSASSRAWQVGR